MTAAAQPVPRLTLTSDRRSSFVAAFLGSTMDAFDYLLVVLVYADIAKKLRLSLEKTALITTVTLGMRPVGAVIFGTWAEGRGRRVPRTVDASFSSVVGFLRASAPSLSVLMILQEASARTQGSPFALAATIIPVFVAVIVHAAIGKQAKGVHFGTEQSRATALRPLGHA